MKKKNIPLVLILTALVLAALVGGCDIFNPAIDPWWVGPESSELVIPIETYTIKFEMEGGTYVDLRDPVIVPPAGPIPDQKVVPGFATVSEPGLVENDDPQYFGGWYTAKSGGTRWEFNKTIVNAAVDEADGKADGIITLYARWSGAGSTVTFDLNPPEGSGMTGTETTYYHPSKNPDGTPKKEFVTPGIPLSQPKGFGIDPSSPFADDYGFTGWYKDEDCTTKWDFATDTVTGNPTLYAGWGTKTKVGVVPPEVIVVPPTPLYPVTFDSDGADEGDPPDTEVIEGEKVPRPGAIHKDGYTFTGWFKDGDTTPWDFNTPVTEDTPLHAEWELIPPPPPTPPPTPTSYTVSFEMEGGKYVDLRPSTDPNYVPPAGPIPEQIVTPGSATVSEPGLVENPDHKYFTGWYTEPNSGGTKWDFDTTVVGPEVDPNNDGKIPLYAGWSDTGYTVSFDPGGDFDRNRKFDPNSEISWDNTTYEPLPEYVAPNVPLSQPAGFGLKDGDPFADDYAFTGWYIDTNGNGVVDEGDTKWDFDDPVPGDMTLYAGWGTRKDGGVIPPEDGGTPTPVYTITFNDNGADNPNHVAKLVPDEVVLSGNALPEPDAIYKKNYVFSGWFKDAKCTVPWDFATETVDEPDDEFGGGADDNAFTLYAKWEAEPYTPPWYDNNYMLLVNKGIGKEYIPFQMVPGGSDILDPDPGNVNYDNMMKIIDQLKKHPDNIAHIVGYKDTPGDTMDTERELQIWWALWQETGVDPKQLVINTALPDGYSDPDGLLNSNMIIAPNDSEGVVGADGDEIKVYLYQP